MITLKKHIAGAIDSVMMNNSKEEIIVEHANGNNEWTGEWSPLNALSLDSLIRAVYIGYEVEKTPEEKVKELYDNYGPNSQGHQVNMDERVQMGIKLALKSIGMKVEGITDDY
jgi:hypothetical protein